jgi:hypothetical protein
VRHEPVRRGKARDTIDPDDDKLDHQGMAIELIDAFHDHDTAALAELSPAEREAQYQARWTLYQYIDALWEGAKERGLNPAILPDWKGVAGMRDIANTLWMRADEARTGDEGE